jgi:hypothetical protein
MLLLNAVAVDERFVLKFNDSLDLVQNYYLCKQRVHLYTHQNIIFPKSVL